MLSIGRFAKKVGVSPRTLRHYESIGLIAASTRGGNQYRYYDPSLIDRVGRIRSLQELGFSLGEIQQILQVPSSGFIQRLKKRLAEVEGELSSLEIRRERIRTLLSVSQKIDSQESINEHERNEFMNAIREEVIEGVKARCGQVSQMQLGYLDRDLGFSGSAEAVELIEAVKKSVQFARENDLILGPGRGSAPSSMTLFALGLNDVEPARHGLLPERLMYRAPEIHIDVEYERGQVFVDFCREISSRLKYGQIQAFKMPLIDIVKNVQQRLGYSIDFSAVDNDSDCVLGVFRAGDVEKVFSFDNSENALIMKFENWFPGYAGWGRMSEYLRSQPIRDFRDVINITALWRPHCQEMIDRLERYRRAKKEAFSYSFLSRKLRESLEPNFGLVIYHEDVIRILAEYTGWDLDRCNRLRVDLRLKNLRAEMDCEELRRLAPSEVVELILAESPWTFCQSHATAFSHFTKQTAVLKRLHRDLYLEEIDRWERKHGLVWDDIGVRLNGVSLLQG